MNKLTKSLSLFLLSFLALTGAVSGIKTAEKEVVAEAAIRSNTQSFTKGNEISVQPAKAKRYNMAGNEKFALYFEYKFEGVADNPDASYVELSIQDTEHAGWLNITGALTLWSNGAANKSAKVTTLDDGWFGVSYEISSFNGDWATTAAQKGKDVKFGDLNLDLLYAKAGSVKLGFVIDWDTWSINKRNKIITSTPGVEFSHYNKFNLSLTGAETKSLYFEYKIDGAGATTVTFMDNWSNVSGGIKIWDSGTATMADKGYVPVKLDDGYYAVYLPVAKFNGNGATKNELTRIYAKADNVGSKLSIDLNTVRFDDRGNVGTRSAGVETNYNWGRALNYNEALNNKLYFEYKLFGEGHANMCFMQGDWLRLTEYFTFDRTSSDYGGVVTELGDGWYGLTILLSGNFISSDSGDRNTIDFIYCGQNKNTAGIAVDFDSFKIVENKTFEMVKGASIRLDGANGIRFRANLAEKDLVQDGSYHMVIIPLDYVEAYGLEEDFVAELGAVPYVDMECEPQQVGDEYYIQGSIVDIKQANIARKFVPIAYTLKEGVRKYAAGSADSEYARSYYEVACACAKDTTYFESLTDSQKMVLKNVIESQDYLYHAESRYFIDALDHTPRVIKELSTGLSFDKECTDVTGDSFVSWKITCSTEGVESDYPWVLIDLGADLDITSTSFNIKFENTWKWLGVNYYGSDLSLLSETKGSDLSTGWNNYEESKTISGVRYLGLCLNFDQYKGQVQSVLLDNLHFSLQ